MAIAVHRCFEFRKHVCGFRFASSDACFALSARSNPCRLAADFVGVGVLVTALHKDIYDCLHVQPMYLDFQVTVGDCWNSCEMWYIRQSLWWSFIGIIAWLMKETLQAVFYVCWENCRVSRTGSERLWLSLNRQGAARIHGCAVVHVVTGSPWR